jgi:hypothetical protein
VPDGAQELAVGKAADRFVYTKNLDGLGILAYGGDLRAAGCLVATDFSFTASRGKTLTSEDMKALLDVAEGGCLANCRYKPGLLPAGLPRVICVQADHRAAGMWMREAGQPRVAEFVEALAPQAAGEWTLTREQFRARIREMVKGFDGHDRAILRRVCIAVPTRPLVRESLVARLEADNRSSAATQRERRAAFWAEKRRQT